jgi:hypothetical protein
MRLALRLAILVLALGGLVYGVLGERRELRPLRDAAASQEIDALAFVEGMTQDAYILRDGALYDAYSLVPEFAQVKDCKT